MGEWVEFGAIKQAVSLEAALRHYRVSGLRRLGDRLEGRCPIHGGQREDSFRASLRKNAFHCFACQAQGNVLDFVAAMEKCSIRQAACRLQRWFAVTPSGPAPAAKGKLVREKEMANAPLRFVLTGVDQDHRHLEARGVDRVTAAKFGVGYYGGPGLMRGRIVIPIANANGQIVGYAGRSVDGARPKYKLPPGFQKGSELFNLQYAAATGSETVIVVEGYFDCMRVHQAGFPFVVALMGSSLSASQERLLLDRFRRVVLMLDGDAAGRAATQAVSERLSLHCSVVAIHLAEGTQPDQLRFAAIGELIRQAEQEATKVFETGP